MLAFDRWSSVLAVALLLGGCPLKRADDPLTITITPPPLAATHTALVSIQDIAIADLPQAGMRAHGRLNLGS